MARINLDQLARRRLYDRSASKQSEAWFQQQVKYLGDAVSPNSIMANGARRYDYLIPGQMYLYFYNAKYADVLPYFDTFPLVIPFTRDAETFTGINFHYLPVKIRTTLLDNMLDFASSNTLNEKTRLMYQWSYIANSSKYIGVKSAVKKYRYDHVQSQFLFIPAQQWFNTVMLPVERFKRGEGGSAYVPTSVVWNDSMRKMV